MVIKFIRDEKGELIAVDENGKEIGKVTTMGDEIKDAKEDKPKQ